ncbi:P-loop containing nucleoside triphosphate hydrolase protein [Tothia fuscella]|uniref:P-loop containing nucleoside triphosphate hydrolase protein n=1 Tax=Tothia fuscella TaxID=1048955 RepID=A0A9P4NV88_9PEZI|nr:P-loop containing nucleoside triphosphate hydrolase protein [Tothia fuscella]
MEEQVERLVEKTWTKFQGIPRSHRLLIAVSGIPGSGKTTLASTIIKRLNERYHKESPAVACSGNDIAAFIPMDGYHLSRAQLDAMPDPALAHARRGAVFTFDGQAYFSLVQKLKQPLLPETKTIHAPSFDHAKKDPIENDIPIPPNTRICIFEGNYCSLDKEPWSEAGKLMDELWFVDVDFEVARRRLVKRHVEAGIAKDEFEADRRARENDLVNGREIVEGRVEVDEVVESVDDEGWR